MRKHMEDKLEAIDHELDSFRDVIKFDSDDWRALPKELQDSINDVALALDNLETSIAEQIGLKIR